MAKAFLSHGFINVKETVNLYTGAGLKRGDVLLNSAAHTEMYIGNGENVGAHINEQNGITGGKTGDQTGKEISIGPYYNSPWNYVLRFMGEKNEETSPPREKAIIVLPVLQEGDTGYCVSGVQGALITRHYSCGPAGADGDFGICTLNAVKKFQTDNGIDNSGVINSETWALLLGGMEYK